MSEKDIEKLIKENNELHTEISVLKEEMAVMQNQLDWFKRQMFGRKTEQSTVIFEGGEQLSLIPDEKAVSEKNSYLSGWKLGSSRIGRNHAFI